MAKRKYSVKKMVIAIKESKGMIYVAARKMGCAANTIYNYAAEYEEVQRAIDEERGMMVDTAELALWKALQNGEAWAISLTLKTLGKKRGYVERQELTGADGKPIDVNISKGYIQVSPDDWDDKNE
ncbi:unnamed protein product [marine sediment metagenome]|uniref:Uncharacterized protein n=1 Tax=marine sediment metagenome TaxID=412755 RepID=X0SN34_9ZZZZ